MAEALGRPTDNYCTGRAPGQSGMATVDLAHDPKPDRRVGLKMLRPVLPAVIGAEPRINAD